MGLLYCPQYYQMLVYLNVRWITCLSVLCSLLTPITLNILHVLKLLTFRVESVSRYTCVRQNLFVSI